MELGRRLIDYLRIKERHAGLIPGVAASLIGLVFFAAVAKSVIAEGRITMWDIRVLHWLHGHNSPTGIRILSAITVLGTPAFLAVPVGLMIILLIRRNQWIAGAWLGIAAIGGEILESVLKLSLRRPRPEFAAPFLHRLTFSLPSGHAMTSLIDYGMLAYILISVWLTGRTSRIAVIVLAMLLTFGIGFSRIYLGVHYLSDVVAGYAAGIFWLSLCITLLNVGQSQR